MDHGVRDPDCEVVALSEALIPAVVLHESCFDIWLEVGQSPQILFVFKTDSQVTLTQLRNESVTARSRPLANKFNYARDMCHGTSIHPVSVKAIFEPGKSQQADGLTKVLAGASVKTFVPDLGLSMMCYITPQTTQWWRSCGVGQGGTLNMENYTIVGATAPVKKNVVPLPPGVPPPPEYLPEMKDEAIVKNTIQALSPRIVAVHGPTGTGKSTVFPLAITHWTEQVEGLTPGLTICAQPRRILAQQLCERVRSNREMRHNDKTVGYMIARESSRDTSTKLLYCTEAIVALKMQAYLVSSAPPLPQDVITTVGLHIATMYLCLL